MTWQRKSTPHPPGYWTDYAPAYNDALRNGLVLQVSLAILTALMLDFGVMQRSFWVAMLGQCCTVPILLCRRPAHPTRVDLWIVRYGILPLLLIVEFLGPMWLAALGIPRWTNL